MAPPLTPLVLAGILLAIPSAESPVPMDSTLTSTPQRLHQEEAAEYLVEWLMVHGVWGE